MRTLDEALEISQSFDKGKSDYRLPANQIGYDSGAMSIPLTLPNSGAVVGHDRATFEPDALSQACSLLSIPFPYISRCSAELQSANMNYWQKRLRGRQLILAPFSRVQALDNYLIARLAHILIYIEYSI